MRIRYVCLSAFLIVSPAAYPGEDLAMQAYERGDFITAYRELDTRARAGDPVAQYNLGFMYYGGEGVNQDEMKAFYWFNQSARSGYPPSQDILGYMYSHGKGVEQDKLRAYVWYSIAAANGIFLADGIRKKLLQELGSLEVTQADLMVEDYLKNYRSAR